MKRRRTEKADSNEDIYKYSTKKTYTGAKGRGRPRKGAAAGEKANDVETVGGSESEYETGSEYDSEPGGEEEEFVPGDDTDEEFSA